VESSRSIFLHEPLIQVVGHAFGATARTFGTFIPVCDWFAFDFVSFAFRTYFGVSRGSIGRRRVCRTCSHAGNRGRGTATILMPAALLRLRQFKSILITHQRCTGISSNSSTSRDSVYMCISLGISVYRGESQKLVRFDPVTMFLRIPPDQEDSRLGVGFSSNCAAVSFTPSSKYLSCNESFFLSFSCCVSLEQVVW
jgi:hypothetical protein